MTNKSHEQLITCFFGVIIGLIPIGIYAVFLQNYHVLNFIIMASVGLVLLSTYLIDKRFESKRQKVKSVNG